MWYWIIPSTVLTGGCLIIPSLLGVGANLVDTWGYKHRRNFACDSRDYYLFLRDRRITGSEYVQSGLENLGKPLNIKSNERIEIPWKA